MFCWRGDVVWKIATEPCPKDFSHVDSDEFILAIPDFTKEPIKADDYTDYQNSFTSSRVLSHDPSRNAVFRKVIMKLSGGVRWIAGAVLERRCPPNCLCCKGKGKCAGFDFIPHYDVHLKKPEYCRHADGEVFPRFISDLTIAIRQLPRIPKRFHTRLLIHHQPPWFSLEGWIQ